MKSVLPYDETLTCSTGGFITKDNSIIVSPHRDFIIDFFNIYGKSKSVESESLKAFMKSFIGSKPNTEDAALWFINQYYRYDILSNCYTGSITTTEGVPSYKYYNYLLMDYRLFQKPYIVYDNGVFRFMYDEITNSYNKEEEKDLNEEIKSIKDKVPVLERKLFFR